MGDQEAKFLTSLCVCQWNHPELTEKRKHTQGNEMVFKPFKKASTAL